MKFNLLLLTIYLIPLILYSQGKSLEGNQNIKLLNERIIKLEKDKIENKELIKRLESANEIIERHDTIFSGISTYGTILGIFIGLVGIFSVIATYLFGIHPAKESINDLDRKFKEFTLKNQKEAIDKLINDLSSTVESEKIFSAYSLSLNQNYKFDKHQIQDIIEILNLESSIRIKSILENLIALHPSKTTENYFIKVLNEGQNIQNFYLPISYFLMYGWDKNYIHISNYLQKSENLLNQFYLAIQHISSTNPKSVLNLLNDSKIVDKILDSNLPSVEEFVNIQSKLDTRQLSETYLIKKAKDFRYKEQEKKSEEKIKSTLNQKNKIDKIPAIIKKHGLYKDKSHIVKDKKGKRIEIDFIVYTALGLGKVEKIVRVDGMEIPLEKLPEKKNYK